MPTPCRSCSLNGTSSIAYTNGRVATCTAATTMPAMATFQMGPIEGVCFMPCLLALTRMSRFSNTDHPHHHLHYSPTSAWLRIVACETACAGAKLDVEQCKEKCFVSGCTSAADEFQALGA